MVHHRLRGLFKHVTLNDMPANTRHMHNACPALGQMMSHHWIGIAPMSGVFRDVYIKEWLSGYIIWITIFLRCENPFALKVMSRHCLYRLEGGGPGVVLSTAASHASVRGSVPGLGGLKETKMFLPHPRVKVSIVGSLRDREVACSASDRQGSNFESCVWRRVSSQSSHHPQQVLLAQFSLYVHKGGLKPDSFHLYRLDCYVGHTIKVLSNALDTDPRSAFVTTPLLWTRTPSKHDTLIQCRSNAGPAL